MFSKLKTPVPGTLRISPLNAIFISAIIVLIVAAGYIYFTEYLPMNAPPTPLSVFAVGSVTIYNSSDNSTLSGLVYVASTLQEQIQGFQNATSFGDCNGYSLNHSSPCIGMMFVTTSTQNLCFWMHNTPLPLQQVWISSSGIVTSIYQAQAESEKNVCHTALDVLETNSSAPISPGDLVTLHDLD